ncbi:MAG: molecular chaperone TorD family protein [Desulfobacterales bacterium]
MTSLILLDKKSREALLDSTAALTGFFWGPDPASSREILQGSFLSPFEDLESRVTYEPPELLSGLRDTINGFADTETLFNNLEEAYVRLFINSRHGITAPLYASCYIDDNASGENAPLMGPPAVLMKKRFKSKGLSLSDTMHEPPDHLSIELEYLYFLLKKGWSDNDPALLSEAVSFAGETMLPWVSILRERIADEKRCRFYPLITTAAVSILAYLGRQTPPI